MGGAWRDRGGGLGESYPPPIKTGNSPITTQDKESSKNNGEGKKDLNTL